MHTNHSLDPHAAAREKRGLFKPDSRLTLALMTTRLQDYPTPMHAAAAETVVAR